MLHDSQDLAAPIRHTVCTVSGGGIQRSPSGSAANKSMRSPTKPSKCEPFAMKVRHTIRSDEDRVLRRIGTVIWSVAVASFVFSAIAWLALLRGLP